MADPVFDPSKPYTVGEPKFDPTKPYQVPEPPAQDFGSTTLNLAAGVGQGVLNIPEGAAQLAEHLPYVGGAVRSMIPQALRDWAKNYQRRAEASTAGRVGEFAGNVLPFLFQPELGIASRAATLGRIPGFLGRVFERATLPSVAEPVTPKPQGDDDYWQQKGKQALIGTAIGTPLEAIASGGAALTGRRVAREQAADQAVRDAASEYGAKVQAHETGTLERAAEQQAAKDAKEAKKAIPEQTTLRWYKETLDRIGLGDQAPTEVSPAASARVQKLVGDHRNEILNRMELNSGDPKFNEQINTIRDETMRDLPESAQTKFYKPPPEQDLASPIIDPTTGKPFPRATRVLGTPGKSTGDWVKTVMEPLAKGNLRGRELSDYISKLGARAEDLAKSARQRPQDERAEMYAMSNALRQVADAVVGHAAGSPEDKLALEAANRAYTMWSIGNDAGRAAQGGVMTPRQLIQTASRRMGEARYKQALDNPRHPDNPIYQHLENQRKRMAEPPPQVRPATAVPKHPGQFRGPPAPPDDHLGQHAANALLHYGLWHAPGVGHAAYWAARPVTHALSRRMGPALSRIGSAIGRGARRVEAPTSAGTANYNKEPAMSYKWVNPGQ